MMLNEILSQSDRSIIDLMWIVGSRLIRVSRTEIDDMTGTSGLVARSRETSLRCMRYATLAAWDTDLEIFSFMITPGDARISGERRQ